MLGAIIGDIAGSKYEFNNYRNENVELLTKGCFFTDDTVCTIANMDWLLHAKERNAETATEYLRKWTRKYPNAGYGGRFMNWVLSLEPKPYGSFGNGSAMRISPVAVAANSVEELKMLSDTFTSITHNHPEGMKGAITVATCVYMALCHKDKKEIADYAVSQYPEIKTLRFGELKETYRFNVTCQGSVPQAIYCFLISMNYEDCIKKTIAIGGDCDTTSAMSGAIAEAFYGIPEELTNKVLKFLDPEMVQIVKEFYSYPFKNLNNGEKEDSIYVTKDGKVYRVKNTSTLAREINK